MKTTWIFSSKINGTGRQGWRFCLALACFLAGACQRRSPGLPQATIQPAHRAASVAVLDEPSSALQRCAECHADIVRQYSASGMSRSWRAVSPQLVPAADSPVVSDRTVGYRYVVHCEAGTISQIETHAHDAGHRAARRADYVVGSGKHAIALVNSDRGYLTELPVGWFSEVQQWRMNPGYELRNHRFSRPVVAGCVACHATTAVPEAPAANRFRLPIAGGIDCDRCHGDSTKHVEFWKSGTGGEPPQEAQLIDPSRLPHERANDLCLQCHLQGDVTVELAGRSPFDFSPGQRLLDQRYDFLIAGQTETLGVASHGARMLQSRCYTASGGRLTCIACHNAHQPAAGITRASYDANCAACHVEDACHRPVTTGSQETSCVGCHMPQRGTREGIHLVFTDHAIPRLPRQAASQPPLLGANSNVQLVSAWPGVKPDEAVLGAAYVLLHETMGPQLQPLERACELLERAQASEPADETIRYWLGSANLARGKAVEAQAQFRAVVTQQPHNHQARFRLALACEAARQFDDAIAEYERLLKDAPGWLEPYPRLAQLYLAQQKPAESARVLRQQLLQQPSAAALAGLAVAQRLAGDSHEQALASIEQAARLDSRLPEVYVARGTLWLLAGEAARARVDFQHVLELDPTNTAARQALAALSQGR